MANKAICVRQGDDRFLQPCEFGLIDKITCKVSGSDTGGGLYVFESVTSRSIGPPRHFHRDQDEWFTVLDGEFNFEVGDDSFHLRPGDSLLAPRRVPHAWACVSEKPGKLVIVCQPAGTMENFFVDVAAKLERGAGPDEFQECYRAHGMEIVGPPIPVS
jgi:mannose-6-phosphate isomerase-like protein (cupin superfamily)